MTFSDFPLNEVSVDPADIYSDHALVTCRLPVTIGEAAVAERLVKVKVKLGYIIVRSKA